MTIERFEDLEVFKRAYKVSLEVHRISLELPKHEQFGLADQIRRASKSICVNVAEGLCQAKLFGGRISAVCANGDWFSRRDASLDPILFGSGLHRGSCVAALAR